MPRPTLSLVSMPDIARMLELARGTPPGAFAEVGVYKGGTAWHLASLAREQGRKLYLYDTFTGIPFCDPKKGDSPTVPVGRFADTSLEAVRAAIPDAHYGVGVFGPDIFDPVPIAFAHIDCDQYESVATCIRLLTPHMVRGSIMLFDDYGCLDGATRAVNEAGRKQHKTAGDKVYFCF